VFYHYLVFLSIISGLAMLFGTSSSIHCVALLVAWPCFPSCPVLTSPPFPVFPCCCMFGCVRGVGSQGTGRGDTSRSASPSGGLVSGWVVSGVKGIFFSWLGLRTSAGGLPLRVQGRVRSGWGLGAPMY
jgi:hypothetical protein